MANILIIEDEISIQKVMKANLEANGHTVLIAGNGEEGIQSMRDTVPDIVLLDLLMPEMSGWDVLRTMRADKGLEAFR
jgi:CheY-like chemotaxis protein